MKHAWDLFTWYCTHNSVEIAGANLISSKWDLSSPRSQQRIRCALYCLLIRIKCTLKIERRSEQVSKQVTTNLYAELMKWKYRHHQQHVRPHRQTNTHTQATQRQDVHSALVSLVIVFLKIHYCHVTAHTNAPIHTCAQMQTFDGTQNEITNKKKSTASARINKSGNMAHNPKCVRHQEYHNI